jgi:FkbM family methyltransferase
MFLSPRAAWKFIGVIRDWPVTLVQTVFKRKGLVRYRLRSGFTLVIRAGTGDLGRFKNVWLKRVFDPQQRGIDFDWSSARTIVDIGAHVGAFMLFATSNTSGARIICLEPEPGNFAMLKHNIEINGLIGRVATENLGVGSGEDTPLLRSEKHLKSGPAERLKDTLMIPTITLAALFDRYSVGRCDFLKLNCCGAEYDAVYSLPPDYLRRIQCIGVVCYHLSLDPTHTCEQMQKYLEDNGFKVHKSADTTLIAIRK